MNIRTGEHTAILPFTRNKLSKSKNSSVANHLLFCSHLASYGDCSILMCENNKVLLELKESLLIMRAHPSLNRSSIAPLYLFNRPWWQKLQILFAFNSYYFILIGWAFYYFVICWAPLLALMLLFNLLFSCLVIRLNIVIVTIGGSLFAILMSSFLIIKAWKWNEETHPKSCWNKIWIFCKMWLCDFFLENQLWS